MRESEEWKGELRKMKRVEVGEVFENNGNESMGSEGEWREVK